MTYQTDYDWYKDENGIIDSIKYLKDRYYSSVQYEKYKADPYYLDVKVGEISTHIFEIQEINSYYLSCKWFDKFK